MNTTETTTNATAATQAAQKSEYCVRLYTDSGAEVYHVQRLYSGASEHSTIAIYSTLAEATSRMEQEASGNPARPVTPRPNYRIFDRTGGGVTHDIYAASLEDAIESGIGRPESEEGDEEGETYETHELECSVVEIVYTPNLSSIEALPGVHSAEVVDGIIHAVIDPAAHDGLAVTLNGRLARLEPAPTDEADEMRVAVCLAGPIPMQIDDDATRDGQWHDCSGTYTPELPDCEVGSEFDAEAMADAMGSGTSDEQNHVWESPYSRSGGGTRMSFSWVCRLCGKYRSEKSPGCQRNPNEALSSITIKDRDEKSEAWLKEMHRDEDGYLPESLAEMLGCEDETLAKARETAETLITETSYDDATVEQISAAWKAMMPNIEEPSTSVAWARMWAKYAQTV